MFPDYIWRDFNVNTYLEKPITDDELKLIKAKFRGQIAHSTQTAGQCAERKAQLKAEIKAEIDADRAEKQQEREDKKKDQEKEKVEQIKQMRREKVKTVINNQ